MNRGILKESVMKLRLDDTRKDSSDMIQMSTVYKPTKTNVDGYPV